MNTLCYSHGMKYIALLRGINVGGNNKVEMKRLKILFETLGFTGVATYINSGNVVFEGGEKPTIELEKLIENGIETEFGFGVRTIVKTARQMEIICQKIPVDWTNDTEQKTDVLFLWPEVDSLNVIQEIVQNPEVDALIYIEGAVIWHIDRADYRLSKMDKFIGTKIYKNMTARNVNTVRKLHNLLV
jgi:uncharacterized protein (DUF1697 family)